MTPSCAAGVVALLLVLVCLPAFGQSAQPEADLATGPAAAEGGEGATPGAGGEASAIPAESPIHDDAPVGAAVIDDPLDDIIKIYVAWDPTGMAVAPMKNIGTQDDANGVGDAMGEVLRRDFQMSGLFEIAPTETYPALVDLKRDGMTASTVDFDGWSMVGVDVLVKGTYRLEGGSVDVDLRLFDVVTGRQIPLNWSGSVVREGSSRKVVHDFVNAVIEYYTGERGVFGSRVLFVGPDEGNFRKVHSIENDGYGLATYDISRGVNILPAWGPSGTVVYTQLGDEGDQVYVYDGETSAQITDIEGWASGVDYCSGTGLFAFTMSVDGNSDIFTMKPDGSELTRLTSDESVESSPSWAPGCKRLAFVSDRTGHPQIYSMAADGSAVQRLTWVGNYNTTPEWSPKGDVIAFTARDERRRFDIFTVAASGGEIVRLTQDQGNNEEPSWAPDGRYLVFQSTRDGRQPRLYMATADGRWQTRITDGGGYRTPRWQR